MAGGYVAYVGTYTREESEGIYILDVDPEYGYMKLKGTQKISNPSFLTVSADGRFLYSNCDSGITSFRILSDGSLEEIGQASVNGLRPNYMSVNRDNTYLVSGGYHDGKLTIMNINEDGSVGEVTDEVFMKGLGSVTGHHYRSHVNCAIFSPDEKYVIAIDIGMDQVKVYSFDKQRGKIELVNILRCELGSGPRHMVFSSDGRYAYITFESKCTVGKFEYHPEDGSFTRMQELSTLPPKYDGSNVAITLKLTSDDRHLLVTNSGNNSVAIYDIDEGDQSMTMSCVLPVSSEYPHDTLIMPNNTMFTSVNQDGNNLTSFKINYEGNYFLMNGAPISIPSPTSIRLVKLSDKE